MPAKDYRDRRPSEYAGYPGPPYAPTADQVLGSIIDPKSQPDYSDRIKSLT